MRMSQQMNLPSLQLPASRFFFDPVSVVVYGPCVRGFRFVAEAGEIRRQDFHVGTLQRLTEFRERFLTAAPAVQTKKNGLHVRIV